MKVCRFAEHANICNKDYPFIKSYLILAYMPKEKDKNEYEDNVSVINIGQGDF